MAKQVWPNRCGQKVSPHEFGVGDYTVNKQHPSEEITYFL